MYWAHRAVVFAIAQHSCQFSYVIRYTRVCSRLYNTFVNDCRRRYTDAITAEHWRLLSAVPVQRCTMPHTGNNLCRTNRPALV